MITGHRSHVIHLQGLGSDPLPAPACTPRYKTLRGYVEHPPDDAAAGTINNATPLAPVLLSSNHSALKAYYAKVNSVPVFSLHVANFLAVAGDDAAAQSLVDAICARGIAIQSCEPG